MKNKLADLNNHLFASLERLGDESLSGDKLKDEIERSKAVAGVAREIIQNGKLVLTAQMELRGTSGAPEFLGVEGPKDMGGKR